MPSSNILPVSMVYLMHCRPSVCLAADSLSYLYELPYGYDALVPPTKHKWHSLQQDYL